MYVKHYPLQVSFVFIGELNICCAIGNIWEYVQFCRKLKGWFWIGLVLQIHMC